MTDTDAIDRRIVCAACQDRAWNGPCCEAVEAAVEDLTRIADPGGDSLHALVAQESADDFARELALALDHAAAREREFVREAKDQIDRGDDVNWAEAAKRLGLAASTGRVVVKRLRDKPTTKEAHSIVGSGQRRISSRPRYVDACPASQGIGWVEDIESNHPRGALMKTSVAYCRGRDDSDITVEYLMNDPDVVQAE